jgi:7,8-dihydroneopterin aldolase/epimerase/oxygenase
MDTIFIRELRIKTVIGIYEWERHIPQTIEVDLEVGLPECAGAHSNNIVDTIDYSKIVVRIQRLLNEKRFLLLENAAESLAETLLHEFGSPWVKVSVAKIAALPNVKRLGVTVERGKRW